MKKVYTFKIKTTAIKAITILRNNIKHGRHRSRPNQLMVNIMDHYVIIILFFGLNVNYT